MKRLLLILVVALAGIAGTVESASATPRGYYGGYRGGYRGYYGGYNRPYYNNSYRVYRPNYYNGYRPNYYRPYYGPPAYYGPRAGVYFSF